MSIFACTTFLSPDLITPGDVPCLCLDFVLDHDLCCCHGYIHLNKQIIYVNAFIISAKHFGLELDKIELNLWNAGKESITFYIYHKTLFYTSHDYTSASTMSYSTVAMVMFLLTNKKLSLLLNLFIIPTKKLIL